MSSQRPGFYFIACPDVDMALEQAAAVLDKYPPASGKWEKRVFWGDEAPPEEFWQNLGQSGLFGASRVIVCRRAQEWTTQVWKELSAALGRRNENVFPIFCLESPWEKGKIKLPACVAKSRCLEFAEKKGWVWKSQGIAQADISRHVDRECKKRGLKFTPEARALFCSAVKPDARAIANELEKLALATPNGEITAEMISVGASNPETDAFECIKCLESGNLAAAWGELAKSPASNMVFYLVALIAREMRILWQISHGAAPWMPPGALDRKKQIARRIGLTGIEAGFTAALEAEWSVKSGRLSPEQSLEMLVAELAGIYAGAPRAGAAQPRPA